MNLEKYIENNFKNNDPICVVGNANIIYNYGKIIDSYKVIIRINKYITSKKYSKQIGSKTTHWCTNAQGDINKYGFKESICPFKRKHISNGTNIISPEYDWRSETGIKRLTTGSTLLYILHKCDITVDAYGFDFLKTGHYWNNNHKHAEVHLNTINEEKKLILSLDNINIKE